MKKATFYHAGCPVCVNAEQELLNLVDTSKVNVEIVHLGEQSDRISNAENAGVKSVPALVLDNGSVLHINHGATMEQVKG
ncbi:thioredoxin family protein [uncultured Kriegella sp.]|uniref:thioredoxin family protein n=1 Tax=uncultured Kriegella sp. TaxID=1798910 RepID=UPI0030D95EE3|tara:strand:+ start:111828 stop:112067 length:240 start_codon:yes stop_codon:yes gene_type:complete